MKKDIIINFIITIVIAVSTFLLNKYFALYLGTENLGLMKLFTQLLAYLNLAEIGLASASAYALYKPLVERNKQEISVVLNTITSLYNKIFLFILIIGLLLNPIIPFFIKNKVTNSVYLYWSLYVISTALNYIFIKYSILFTADQKFSFVRLVEGGSKIFCQLVQMFIIIKYRSFLGYIIFLILNNLIQYIFYKYHYKKYYKYVIETKEKNKGIIKDLKNLFWHKLAGLVVFNTDLILISKFISLEIVGIYASYQMITQMITTILNIVLNVLKPKIGKFVTMSKKEEIFECFKALNIFFLWIAIILTFSTYVLINKFITLWLGEKFILSQFTVILLMCNLFIESFRGILGIFKEALGFFDDIHLPISEAVINFVVSIVLVKIIGLNGVIIGTICSNILIIFIARPILVFRRCFDKNIYSYMRIYGAYFLLIILSLVVLSGIFALNNLSFNKSWINWIVEAFITCIVVSGISFFIFLLNKDFRNYLKFIRNYLCFRKL